MGSAARLGARPMEFITLLAPLGVIVFEETAHSAGSSVVERKKIFVLVVVVDDDVRGRALAPG